MISQLYEPFRTWSEGGSVYILSDTHFGDDDCRLMAPDWPEPDEQVEIINSIVRKGDTFVCLGDVGNIEYIRKIKANYKVLITGNHDRGTSFYERDRKFINLEDELLHRNIYRQANGRLKISLDDRKEVEKKYGIEQIVNDSQMPFVYGVRDNHLFDEVYSGPLFISDRILLSHEPVGLPFCLNIHGHDHMGVEKYSDGCFYLNLAANVCGYKPVSLSEIIRSGTMKSIPTIHRTVIDEAAKRKEKYNYV